VPATNSYNPNTNIRVSDWRTFAMAAPNHAYTVVRATQRVNEKGQFWGVRTQNSITPEPID